MLKYWIYLLLFEMNAIAIIINGKNIFDKNTYGVFICSTGLRFASVIVCILNSLLFIGNLIVFING